MSSPERPGSRPNELLDFMVPHDGSQPEVPPEEQAAVKEGFEELWDDLMFQWPLYVNSSYTPDPDTLPLENSSTLWLEVPRADSYTWSVMARGHTAEDLDVNNLRLPFFDSSKSLLLTQMHRGKEAGVLLRYFIDSQGVVRRKTRFEHLHAPRSSPHAALAFVEEEHEAEVLAEQMGMQRQPIGMDELQGLAAFLLQPAAVPSRHLYETIQHRRRIRLPNSDISIPGPLPGDWREQNPVRYISDHRGLVKLILDKTDHTKVIGMVVGGKMQPYVPEDGGY